MFMLARHSRAVRCGAGKKDKDKDGDGDPLLNEGPRGWERGGARGEERRHFRGCGGWHRIAVFLTHVNQPPSVYRALLKSALPGSLSNFHLDPRFLLFAF